MLGLPIYVWVAIGLAVAVLVGCMYSTWKLAVARSKFFAEYPEFLLPNKKNDR